MRDLALRLALEWIVDRSLLIFYFVLSLATRSCALTVAVSPFAHWVAHFWWFDFDDFSAVVAEKLSREWSSNEASHF